MRLGTWGMLVLEYQSKYGMRRHLIQYKNYEPPMAIMEANAEPKETEVNGMGAVRQEISIGHAWLFLSLYYMSWFLMSWFLSLGTPIKVGGGVWQDPRDSGREKESRQRKHPMQKLNCAV